VLFRSLVQIRKGLWFTKLWKRQSSHHSLSNYKWSASNTSRHLRICKLCSRNCEHTIRLERTDLPMTATSNGIVASALNFPPGRSHKAFATCDHLTIGLFHTVTPAQTDHSTATTASYQMPSLVHQRGHGRQKIQPTAPTLVSKYWRLADLDVILHMHSRFVWRFVWPWITVCPYYKTIVAITTL